MAGGREPTVSQLGACPETFALFGKDIFLTKEHGAGLAVACKVEFSVAPGGPRGEPHARATKALDKTEGNVWDEEEEVEEGQRKTRLQKKGVCMYADGTRSYQ